MYWPQVQDLSIRLFTEEREGSAVLHTTMTQRTFTLLSFDNSDCMTQRKTLPSVPDVSV